MAESIRAPASLARALATSVPAPRVRDDVPVRESHRPRREATGERERAYAAERAHEGRGRPALATQQSGPARAPTEAVREVQVGEKRVPEAQPVELSENRSRPTKQVRRQGTPREGAAERHRAGAAEGRGEAVALGVDRVLALPGEEREHDERAAPPPVDGQRPGRRVSARADADGI